MKLRQYSKKEKILSLIFLIIGVLFLNFLLSNTDQIVCWKFDQFKKEYYSGRIVDKYIDKWNHNDRVLIVETENDTLKLFFNKDVSSFYEEVRINDEVEKRIGSNEIKVNGVNSFKIYYGVNCENE